jgi:hypothetical protein
MRCKECNCCHEVPLTRWSATNRCYITKYVYKCFGVKEPFVIEDINIECTEYPDKAVDIKNAIEHFKYGISHDIFSEPVTSYAKMAVEALEKQIPKKVVCEGDDENDWVHCPCCDEILGINESVYDAFYDNDWKSIYCHKCGQSLTWK